MGAYKVVVVAPDGDIAAQADLVIVAAAPMGVMTAEEHAKMNTSPMATAEPHATAELMDLDVRTTAGEWVAIVTVVVGCVAAGVLLLTRRAT